MDTQPTPGTNNTAASGPPPSVFVVSEIRLLSEGLAAALAPFDAISIAGHCTDPAELLGKLRKLSPDIILLDAALPAAPSLVGQIPAMAPHIKLVILALAETPENVITWAEAGVAGYIPKTAGLADIVPILVGIMNGEQICSRSVAAGLMRRLHHHPNTPHAALPGPMLTMREMQIIELLGAGLSNKEIATRLQISVTTTKSHVHNLLVKLGVQRRSQAALFIRQTQQARSIRQPVPFTAV